MKEYPNLRPTSKGGGRKEKGKGEKREKMELWGK